jgi:thiamine kinase-like enzyme
MNQDFLLKHDYLQFVNLPNLKISRFVLAKYKKLVNAYKDLPCIFSHNDLSPDNILFEKENK